MLPRPAHKPKPHMTIPPWHPPPLHRKHQKCCMCSNDLTEPLWTLLFGQRYCGAETSDHPCRGCHGQEHCACADSWLSTDRHDPPLRAQSVPQCNTSGREQRSSSQVCRNKEMSSHSVLLHFPFQALNESLVTNVIMSGLNLWVSLFNEIKLTQVC